MKRKTKTKKRPLKDYIILSIKILIIILLYKFLIIQLLYIIGIDIL